MSFSDQHPLSRIPGPVLTPPGAMRPVRCFRTDADGRIALGSDWLKLLGQAHPVGPLALQTNHSHARLIALTGLPRFTERPDGSGSDSEDGALRFHFSGWHRAWGILRLCECCDSPGRVEVCNADGVEFFQFCAMPSGDPAAWADFLASVALTTGESRPAPTSDGALPLAPRSALRLRHGPATLVSLLKSLGECGYPVRGSLRTPEACHTREFVPRQVTVEDGVLSAGDICGRLQLALCALGGSALERTRSGWVLHVVTRADAILFTFSSPSDPQDGLVWHAALRSAFPFLR